MLDVAMVDISFPLFCVPIGLTDKLPVGGFIADGIETGPTKIP